MSGPTQPRARIKMRCPNCGSEAICKDAWASWDETNQRWELGGVYDHETCIECEREGDDHFDRIDIETGRPHPSALGEGLPDNCLSGDGQSLATHPKTAIDNRVHRCPDKDTPAATSPSSNGD